jgi:hypothetical protein
VAVKSIQLGQVWRQDQSGQDYLVTKVYSEVFAGGASLPGFTFTQEGSF